MTTPDLTPLLDNYLRFAAEPLGAGPDDLTPLDLVPAGDLEEAYELQNEFSRQLRAQTGWTQVGWKVAMTAAGDQMGLGTTEPAYGPVFDAQVHSRRLELELSRLNDVILEPELVVRTVADIDELGDDEWLKQNLEATGGIEIPMSRFPGWFPVGGPQTIDLHSFITDTAVSGYLVTGRSWVPLSEHDPAAITVELSGPAGQSWRGTAERVLGSPLTSVRWLFERVLRRSGTIPAGTIVSSGTFLTPRRPEPGTFDAVFTEGIDSASVTFV